MSRLAVAAPNEHAAEAGAAIGRAGGNAVDAAVAAVMAAMVTEPGIVSIGGGAYLTVWSPDGSPVTVDGNVEMPGRGLPEDRFGGGVFEITTGYGGGVSMLIGHGSVATPGALAAVELVQHRFGRAPWGEALAPAIDAARGGFPLGAASSYYLDYVHEPLFGWHPEARAAIHDEDGALLPPGSTILIDGLADTLEAIARDGADVFYRGELAAAIADDIQANDGILTRTDLEAYEPIVRPALTVDLDGWRLATNPAPAIGGVTLSAMLALLDHLPDRGWDERDLRRLVAVQQAVLGHRVERLDRADDRVAAARELLALAATGDLQRFASSPSTVHVSAVDEEGLGCAVTSSAGYGSGVVAPGGVWMNNCLGELELNPGGLHALPVGARLPSNMAPTVARTRGREVLAVGSPGADRITTAILQTVAGYFGGLSLRDAVDHPRLHVRHTPEGPVVDHEEDLDLPADLGIPTVASHPHAMFFGGVAAALRTPDGTLEAAADPRRTGATRVT